MTRVLLTGAAGFIGYHVAEHLLSRGDEVVGADNLNSYYNPALKEARLARLSNHSGFAFHRVDLADRTACGRVFEESNPELVIHLAAQVGVRYSVENPRAYVEANLVAFMNILEECRERGVRHLTYASSSSVYGLNTTMPFSVHHNVDHPASLYAATKKANELMAHTYSHLYGLPTTGLRFFTVYGPWGRPDMAYFKFTRAIFEGKPIDVYNHGNMRRDFTYIDDIVDGVVRAAHRPAAGNDTWDGAAPDPGTSRAPYKVYNIGNNQAVPLMRFIEVLEDAIGRKAEKRMVEMQLGDVPATYADVDDLRRDVGFEPRTPIEEGIPRFVAWYREHYQV